jgi:hypothetical protein
MCVGGSRLRSCVRTVSHAPGNPGQTQRFTGPHRCTSWLREVVDRKCVGGIWCASARASGINFQACSFNHSDISPCRINNLRSRLSGKNANCVRPSNVSRSLAGISSIAADGRSVEDARTSSTTPTRCATAMDRRGSCTTVTSRGCSHAKDGCAPSRTRGSSREWYRSVNRSSNPDATKCSSPSVQRSTRDQLPRTSANESPLSRCTSAIRVWRSRPTISAGCASLWRARSVIAWSCLPS